MYYQNYHKHTSLSHRYNKDSSLVPMDYFKAMKPLADKGIPQIYSTLEHGWQGNYFKIYSDLEKFNKKNSEANSNYKPIKFIFGVEGYWVWDRFEKDNSNCHIVLLAKNDNGRKKLNRIIYESYKTGYYYKGRMDVDLLLQLPKDDVMVTTACVAFWNRYNIDKLDDFIMKLYNHFTDFYLEVQANNTNLQKRVNSHIIGLHKQYGIPIISATDSHYISNSQSVERDELLKSNSIDYPDEAGNYMDFPSCEELVKRYREQGVLSQDEIIEAIENTNKILDFEDIILDKSIKVPVAKKYKNLSQEKRNKLLFNILVKEWKLQREDINEDLLKEYQKEILNNYNEVIACGMADYFIDSYEIMKLGQEKYNGILTPSGRGSGVSFYMNKLLRLTKVDKINSPVTMYAERFLTSTRVLESRTPPDIDNNVSDREPFIQAQRDLIGKEGTFDLLALGTLKYKSAFKMYSRVYNLDPQLANEVTKQIDKYESALKHMDEDETEDDYDIFDYVDKQKYGYLIEGCQKYRGIVDTLKSHPCFTENVLVMTDNGYKKISDIKVGDNVLTIDNDFHKVKRIMNHEANDIYSLNLQGSINFEVTSNHPFFTSSRKYKNAYYINGEKRRELCDYKWKEVKDLEKGDLIGVAINQNSILPNIDFVNSSNKNFWWWLGRYFGDGWRSHTVRKSGKRKGDRIKDVIVCCNKNNNETQDIINRLDWCSYRIVEENTTNKIYIKCKGLYEWLDQFGDYASGKHFNNTIFDLPKEYLEVFIDGYLSADGHKDKNVFTLTTINEQIAYGFASCVHKVYNTPCRMVLSKTSGTENICGRTVNCHNRYRVSFKKYSAKQDRAFYKNGYMWYPYVSKEKLDTNKTVYNLEVEDNHTYTVYNYIVHNCGTLCYGGDAIEDVGVIMVRSESTGRECFVALQESSTIDEFGYLKQDYLVVDSIGLTYDIYKEIGIEPMTVNELLKAIDNDKATWDIYAKGYTMCINQVEKQKTTQKAMRYKPKNISELCQFIAGIRPSFQSMYKVFESREHFDYGIKAFDDVVQDEYMTSSFLLYQETLMKVLGFAGFPMSETYTIVKAISKKKDYIINGAKEKFIPNFTKSILDTKETEDEKVAEQMAEKVWEVIKASAQYGFNSSHSYCMAIDSVTLAWLKAHYPLEFYKCALQRYTDKGNKDKVMALKKEMILLDIDLVPIKFGDDNRGFSVNREKHVINQTMTSIKSMGKHVADNLYALKDNTYPTFVDLLYDIWQTKACNKTELEILIKLDYFKEFGNIKQLLMINKMFRWFMFGKSGNSLRKTIKKADCNEQIQAIISKHCQKETDKQFSGIDNLAICKELEPLIKYKTPDLLKMYYEVKYLGYTNMVVESPYWLVEGIETNNWGTVFLTIYKASNSTIKTVKVNRKEWKELELEQGDIIDCIIGEKEKRKKETNEEGKEVWVGTGEYEEVINMYSLKYREEKDKK